MMTRACLRSGYCCKRGPCAFGKWNEDKQQCEYLEGDAIGEYSCGKYEEIIEQPGSYWNPAFGAGCCSSLNLDRLTLVKRRGGEVFVDASGGTGKRMDRE